MLNIQRFVRYLLNYLTLSQVISPGTYYSRHGIIASFYYGRFARRVFSDRDMPISINKSNIKYKLNKLNSFIILIGAGCHISKLNIGDPGGIRTREPAVKGQCLNRLTTGPLRKNKGHLQSFKKL